ncbi:hypothetical protein M3Y94_01262000 [Aphelenchoides besseyi]|nr:hypothetical protein M3Y94_01262000 [Aphelenchoides besseyi]KAI6222553.1 hypothetical protein M3Y95_00905600 [Aphelenchoides besseyi]
MNSFAFISFFFFFSLAKGAYENTLIIDLGNPNKKANDQRWPSSRDQATQELTANIKEVKNLVVQMDRQFNERLDRLDQRITRLETNQKSVQYMMAASDWKPLSDANKKIRVFTARSKWEDAEEVCRAHSGKLLTVESDDENRRVTDYLQNYEQNLYWMGIQTNITFTVPAYHNFDRGDQDRCAALSTAGKWTRRECTEEHGFICQF